MSLGGCITESLCSLALKLSFIQTITGTGVYSGNS